MALITIHPEIRKKWLVFFHSTILIAKLTALDQIVKWWMISYVKRFPGYVSKMTDFFDLVYSWNYGISFGFFTQYQEYSNQIFLGINACITIFLWYLLLTCKTFRSFLGYSFIVGGALGNLCDRIFRGAVFDFISLHWHDFYFAAFNLADSFIFIGVVILIYDHYRPLKIVAKAEEALYDETAIEAERIRQLDEQVAQKGIRE